jgi:AcrR family transcriptional regulator
MAEGSFYMPEKTTTVERTDEGARKKRQAIIEAASGIFARQGYESTTIAEIASAAGVAVGTVYLYFHNKREIYLATSLSLIEEIINALVQPELLQLPLTQVPRTIVEKCFQIGRKKNQLFSLFQLDLQSQTEIKMHQHAEQALMQSIESFLQLFIARGDFQPFDTAMYAMMLFRLMHSVMYECFCLQRGADEERYREQMIDLIERLFFGPALYK